MKGTKKMISKSIAIEKTSHNRGVVNAVKFCSRGSLILLLLALAFAVPAWAQVCVPAPSGMVSWWPGDGNANDIKDGNNGSLVGNVTFAQGEVGQAFSFNSSGAEVLVPHNANQNTGAQISVDAWIFIPNPLVGFTTASIINKRSSGNSEGYTFELVNGFGGDSRNGFQPVNNGLQFEITTPNGAFVNAITSSNAIGSGQWFFVAGTYDGSTIKVFVNGSQLASKSITGSINAVSDDLVIGRNIVNGLTFPGLIDEVELFNRALSPAEILAIFAAGSLGKCKAGSARKAYVTNAGANTVSVIDLASNTVSNTVTVGRNPVFVALTPDGASAYVTNAGASTVSVINTTDNSIVTTVNVGFYPVHAAVTPNGNSVYVTNAGANSVSVISTLTNTVVKTVLVGANPVHVAIAPDGGHAYVTNAGSNNVSVIETTNNTVTATVPVGRNPDDVAVF